MFVKEHIPVHVIRVWANMIVVARQLVLLLARKIAARLTAAAEAVLRLMSTPVESAATRQLALPVTMMMLAQPTINMSKGQLVIVPGLL